MPLSSKSRASVKKQLLLHSPETIRSFELGYKGLLLAENLQLDVDFYYNKYTQFIAQVEMNVPKSSPPDSVAFYLNDNKSRIAIACGPIRRRRLTLWLQPGIEIRYSGIFKSPEMGAIPVWTEVEWRWPRGRVNTPRWIPTSPLGTIESIAPLVS